jgi:hypothetical protein
VELTFGYPAEIAALIARFRTACDHAPAAAQYESFFELASALLRRVHEISPEQACELLSVTGEELPALVAAIVAVISEVQTNHDSRAGGMER